MFILEAELCYCGLSNGVERVPKSNVNIGSERRYWSRPFTTWQTTNKAANDRPQTGSSRWQVREVTGSPSSHGNGGARTRTRTQARQERSKFAQVRRDQVVWRRRSCDPPPLIPTDRPKLRSSGDTQTTAAPAAPAQPVSQFCQSVLHPPAASTSSKLPSVCRRRSVAAPLPSPSCGKKASLKDTFPLRLFSSLSSLFSSSAESLVLLLLLVPPFSLPPLPPTANQGRRGAGSPGASACYWVEPRRPLLSSVGAGHRCGITRKHYSLNY